MLKKILQELEKTHMTGEEYSLNKFKSVFYAPNLKFQGKKKGI